MLVKTNNKIDGVAAANDSLASAVVAALKAKGLSRSRSPARTRRRRASRTSSPAGRRATVYKDVPLETKAAAAGRRAPQGRSRQDNVDQAERAGTRSRRIFIPPGHDHKVELPAALHEGFLKKNDVCNGEYAKYCVKPAGAKGFEPVDMGVACSAGGPRLVVRAR